MGHRVLGLRASSHRGASALIVIRLSRVAGVAHDIVYNGSLARAVASAGGLQSNGQGRISQTRLRALDSQVPDDERVPLRAREPAVPDAL